MTDRLSTTFAALADPTRRAILARLAAGEASVTELGEPFAMSLPAVSKHLKVLERAGLIARAREAQWRPCRLEAAPLRDAVEWLNRYRLFWSSQLDRLAAFVEKDSRPPGRVPGSNPDGPRRPRRSTRPAGRRKN
jgi:DNA-binding transcriptional ArsR family regulator